MPSTGTPSSKSSRRSSGAPSEYTDAGPPDSTSAAGRRARIRSREVSWGSNSANTPHSRIRRAISWEYCPPKSRTRTSSRADSAIGGAAGGLVAVPAMLPGRLVIRYGYSRRHRGAAVRAHAHRLVALQLLALGLQGRGDHHLGALEVANVLVAAGGHRGAQRPDQVEGAVVLLGGSEQDLLQGAVLLGGHAGAAGQRGVEGCHAPVETAPRRLLRAGEGRADHHRIGAAGDRLGDVAAGSH